MGTEVLRRVAGGYAHWCPACRTFHVVPTDAPHQVQWNFDGNMDTPTFAPAVRIKIKYDDGAHTLCHYSIRAGVVYYCEDCTHALAGQVVALPPFPPDQIIEGGI